MLTGNEFQTLEAENRKARDPKNTNLLQICSCVGWRVLVSSGGVWSADVRLLFSNTFLRLSFSKYWVL